MNRAEAESLVEAFRSAKVSGFETLDPAIVESFHPWARGRLVLGVHRYGSNGDPIHLLVIESGTKKRPEGFYLSVYGDPLGSALMEVHRLEGRQLHWRYVPKSRDGRNSERQERFAKSYGSLDVALQLPAGAEGVEAFLGEVRRVVEARRFADEAKAPTKQAEPRPAAWIFQASPEVYDLPSALGALKELDWNANQYADRIQEGDRVFLWLSGRDGGLLAYGTVTAAPTLRSMSEGEKRFVLDEAALGSARTLKAHLRVERVLEEPLERETLKDDPRLVNLSFLKASQGTNFPVSASEAQALLDLADGGTPPRVVKISPGETGRLWDDCLRGGYICLGWERVGDLLQYQDKESFREAFRREYPYSGNESAVTKKANEVWTFRELKPGDHVVANRGTSEVLGVGRVIEPGYVYRPDRPEYQSTVNVEWDTSLARRIPKQSYWGTVTVADVPTELYRAIVAGGEPPKLDTRDGTRFLDLSTAIQEAGLSYSDEVLSAYLLALQSKRFVILTGISGTGKTQLALTVARVLGRSSRTRKAPVIPEGAFEFATKPYSLKYNRLVLPKSLVSAARIPEDVLQGRRGHIEVSWPNGEARLAMTWAGGSALMVSFSGAFRRWFESTFSVGDPFFIELEELSEDAPHRLRFGVPKTETKEIEEEAKYALVAVRPDWTDHRGLLGYYNPILREYVATEFLRLLMRADAEAREAEREGRIPDPYFLILDEMNLARVEHYFSDFLSAAESGEALELHDDDDLETGEKVDSDPIPKRMGIPRNLYVTGTVNVDETTYMFSPKVLDRAFVMELNLVDLEGFGATGVAGELDSEDAFRLTGFPDKLETARLPSSEDWQELGALLEGALRRVVVGLHEILERHNRHFGYRVANEIGRFVHLASGQCSSADDAQVLWTALDLAILFKVLPKLHGTQQELSDLLASLFVFATTADSEAAAAPGAPYEGWGLERDRLRPSIDSGLEDAYLPRSAAKLYRMARQLDRRGFTSFIE